MSAEIRHCAVCMAEFNMEQMRTTLFVCGHAFWCDCTLMMIKKQELRTRVQSMAFPTCRVRCPVDEISFTAPGGLGKRNVMVVGCRRHPVHKKRKT